VRFTRTDLIGNWRARREIEDRRAGTRAYFTGVAVFAPTEAGCTYRETGRLHLPDGSAMEARRCYLWRFYTDGRVEILFEDGRPFHVLDPSDPGRLLVHPCGQDCYEGRYTVEGPHAWVTTWRVTGPAKDLVLRTRYTLR